MTLKFQEFIHRCRGKREGRSLSIAVNEMDKVAFKTVFVRDPLDKFFAGVRAHYTHFGIAKDDSNRFEKVIDHIQSMIMIIIKFND